MRIARELPEKFRVTGVLVRDREKGWKFSAVWNVPTFQTLEGLLPAGGARPAFVLTSVPWAITPDLIRELVSYNLPVLAETPPAPDLGGLNSLWYDVGRTGKVQVAEQYALQPMVAARLNVARSGKLGTITQAQISAAHGYHGVSVLRRALGITFEDAKIAAIKFSSPIVAGPGREGPPAEEKIINAGQTIATLNFDGKIGIFDFTGEQYFSYIRSNRYLIRGECGEISNTTVRCLKDFRTPFIGDLRRVDAGGEGNLEGLFHKGVLLGDEWVFTNPFPYARLTDDEIAIASLLDGMGKYAEGGPDIYSLAEASQDHYLGICIDRAAASGDPITTEPQGWAV